LLKVLTIYFSYTDRSLQKWFRWASDGLTARSMPPKQREFHNGLK